MAAASYATDLVDIITDPASSTGWTLISSGGGGASSFTAPETDDYVQGTQCISRNPWSSSVRGMVYNSTQTVASGNAVWMWVKADVAQALATKASGGIQLLIGSGTAAFKAWYVDGSDTYTFGGWKCVPVDPTVTQSETVGSPTSTTSYFGARWNVPSSGPSKGFPFKIDAIRRGRTLTVTGGDLANGYATFLSTANYQGDISRQWGQLQFQNGVYTMQGKLALGSSGTAVDFRDSNRTVFVANTEFVGAAFNAIEVANASSRVDWTNISITALGTVSKGTFEALANATINLSACTFVDMSTFVFQSSTSVNGCTFRRCGQITQGSAIIEGGTAISNSPAAVALLCDNLDNVSETTFTSTGTGHAIQLTSAHAGNSYTLTDVVFTGYASADGTTGNEAIYNNSGGAVTINVVGGSTPSIRNGAGASTTVVSGSVTVTLGVSNATGSAIQNANALVYATAGGPFPANATVTIANSGTTATVTHTGHPFASGDKVLIKGASHAANRGVFSITVTGANSYTYTMASAPGSNPTGTITSTFVLLSGLTNAQGELTMSRVFPSNQPVAGWARKSSAAPYYKTGPISGTVNSGTGATLTALLVADE